MSADNFIIIDLKNLTVTYGQGDGQDKPIQCTSLEDAVLTAQQIDEEKGGVEYGVSFTGSLKNETK